MKPQAQSLAASINWEWVHSHHTKDAGPVRPGPWLTRILAHARRNGWRGTVTPRGACRIINTLLY